MEKYVGIIVAEDKELDAIKQCMLDLSEINIYNIVIYKGIINNKTYLLVKCGVGKVNSARTAQILIDKFDISCIINTGSAGSVNSTLNIGDIVVGTKLVQHDFDVTAFGREKGFISDTGKFFESDKKLIDKCKNVKIPNQNILFGTIASGDIFCTDINMKNKIRNKFDCDCIEMEGAAIAQVCFLSNIPFIIIRSISDTPNGSNNIDFNTYLEFASKNCAEFIKQLEF